jgi:hypothetical protein
MTTEHNDDVEINDINERRAARRAAVRANRSLAELDRLANEAFVNIQEMSALTKMSVEALLMQRSRGKPPLGFKHGREIRYTMGEFRDLPTQLAKLVVETRARKATKAAPEAT